MKRIGLISDTHGFLDPSIKQYFAGMDEIWHAGDIGREDLMDELENMFLPGNPKLTIRAVYGNIDGGILRQSYPEFLPFYCEELKVLMTHIAGYPGRYNGKVRRWIRDVNPGLVVAGHSHIVKVMRDPKHHHLFLNPGAAGKQGFHRERTLMRFIIQADDITNLELIKLGKRGK